MKVACDGSSGALKYLNFKRLTNVPLSVVGYCSWEGESKSFCKNCQFHLVITLTNELKTLFFFFFFFFFKQDSKNNFFPIAKNRLPRGLLNLNR